MTDGQEPSPIKELSAEELERILPDSHHRETFKRLISHLDLDRTALVVLKGHLVLEEQITRGISNFLNHPEHLEDARLSFAQKLAVARCCSLDQNKNSMWELIAKLNRLRNNLSHSLEGESRTRATEAVRAAYTQQRDNKLEDWEKSDETLMVLAAVALCLGFLDAFEQETDRFRGWIKTLDYVINPHRYAKHGDQPRAGRSE